MKPNITVNAMVKNEPLAFYSLCSVAPYVDDVLLVDTGSEPEYLQQLEKACQLFPNIKLVHKTTKDGHGWTTFQETLRNVDEDAGKQIADVRRWMHENSKNNLIMILDGDEVWPENSIKYATSIVYDKMIKEDMYTANFHFYDFTTHREMRQRHWMNRFFTRDNIEIRFDYPFETHYEKGRIDSLYPIRAEKTVVGHEDYPVFHYESIVKPHRKEIHARISYDGPHPEVFEKHSEFNYILKEYGL